MDIYVCGKKVDTTMLYLGGSGGTPPPPPLSYIPTSLNSITYSQSTMACGSSRDLIVDYTTLSVSVAFNCDH